MGSYPMKDPVYKTARTAETKNLQREKHQIDLIREMTSTFLPTS